MDPPSPSPSFSYPAVPSRLLLENESSVASPPPPRLHARDRPGNFHSQKQRRLREAQRRETRRMGLVGRRNVRLGDFPPELLYNICCFLSPADLWNLMQTARVFNELTSNHPDIWRDTFALTMTPAAPPHIPATQWVHLLYFSRTCSTPGCTAEGDVVFSLHRRCCIKCLRKSYISEPYSCRHPEFKAIFPEIRQLLPYHVARARGDKTVRYFRISDLQNICREWNSLVLRLREPNEVLEWVKEKKKQKDSEMKPVNAAYAWAEAASEGLHAARRSGSRGMRAGSK